MRCFRLFRYYNEKTERAAVLVESALALPVLFLVVLSAVEISLNFYHYSLLVHVTSTTAQDAAEILSIETDPISCQDFAAQVNSRAYSRLTEISNSENVIFSSQVVPDTVGTFFNIEINADIFVLKEICRIFNCDFRLTTSNRFHIEHRNLVCIDQ